MRVLCFSLVLALGVMAACKSTPAPRAETQQPLVTINCGCCSGSCGGGGQLPPDAGTPPPDGGTEPPVGEGRLHTQGNGIYTEAGTRWHGRGANLMDTRGCNACSYNTPSVAEVNRRADELVRWGATFIRLDLESYAQSQGRLHWADFQQDPAYLADILNTVRHIQTKPGVYVQVSLWVHPSIGAEGRPTQATADAWAFLAHELRNEPRVFFGIVNEPENNYDGQGDAAVHAAMTTVVNAIRAKEDTDGVPHHLIAVQGTGGWARLLNYYITHPIQSDNIIYEAHIYNPQADFNNLITTPAATLPVVIGEFGPVSGFMTLTDTQALMDLADSLQVPWAAWTFHMRCSPNLLVDHSQGSCGVGMTLEATQFGQQVKDGLTGTTRALLLAKPPKRAKR